MKELHFGDGSNALDIVVAQDLSDIYLLIRPNMGSHKVGEPTNEPEGKIIYDTDDAVGMFFSNVESVDVVIDMLQRLRKDVAVLHTQDAQPVRVWPNDGTTQCDDCQKPIDEPEMRKRPDHCHLPHYGECGFFKPKQERVCNDSAH